MTKEILLQKLNGAKLRKVRSKMIKEALEIGSSSKGNHKIDCYVSTTGIAYFDVYYRGTVIAEIELAGNIFKVTPIGAGEYENTPATIRQRKELQEATMELQGAVS